MVGKKWVDGELVDNPDSQWVISDATREMLRKDITAAMSDGASNDQLARVISDAYAFSRDRADLIARTETANADVKGSVAGWSESGVVESAEFSASPDCCDECQAEDGKIVPIDDPEAIDLPHPGCRCAWLPVLADNSDNSDDTTED
jgi:SPP1 gp7 family putative phage head morphogenesis protein